MTSTAQDIHAPGDQQDAGQHPGLGSLNDPTIPIPIPVNRFAR